VDTVCPCCSGYSSSSIPGPSFIPFVAAMTSIQSVILFADLTMLESHCVVCMHVEINRWRCRSVGGSAGRIRRCKTGRVLECTYYVRIVLLEADAAACCSSPVSGSCLPGNGHAASVIR
jgi:hypothetical protein